MTPFRLHTKDRNRTGNAQLALELGTGSRCFSGDRASARRKLLDAVEGSHAGSGSAGKGTDAQRRFSLPTPLPVGETRGFGGKAPKGDPHALPVPKANTASDDYGWNAGPKEITSRELEEELVGREVARDRFVEGVRQERELKDQTRDVIRRLASVGIDGELQGREMAMVGLVSGKAKPLPSFRNCNMLPSMQSRNVRDMLTSVAYLFDVTRKGPLRMLTVSGGWIPLSSYREHHKLHTRRMSKFANHPVLRELGITVEFYNVENTLHRAENRQAMLNLHSHVLIKCRKRLGKKRWMAFLGFARNFFPKGYVHDSPIKKPNEVVKYVFKPSQFVILSDEELGELFRQVTGGRPKYDPETGEIETRRDADGQDVLVLEGPLKFFHPMGFLRKFRQTLRERRQKLIRVPTACRTQWPYRRMYSRSDFAAIDAASARRSGENRIAIDSWSLNCS